MFVLLQFWWISSNILDCSELQYYGCNDLFSTVISELLTGLMKDSENDGNGGYLDLRETFKKIVICKIKHP